MKSEISLLQSLAVWSLLRCTPLGTGVCPATLVFQTPAPKTQQPSAPGSVSGSASSSKLKRKYGCPCPVDGVPGAKESNTLRLPIQSILKTRVQISETFGQERSLSQLYMPSMTAKISQN